MSGRSSIPSTVTSEASIPSRWTSEARPESLFGGKDAPLFGRRQRRARGPRLPVIAGTGFFGSGETTLIRALLGKPEGAHTAGVVQQKRGKRIAKTPFWGGRGVDRVVRPWCPCCDKFTPL